MSVLREFGALVGLNYRCTELEKKCGISIGTIVAYGLVATDLAMPFLECLSNRFTLILRCPFKPLSMA